VYEALAKRHPKSRSRGRRGTPAEVVLRLLVLKHIRNWSYQVLEREVRANLVYRDFTRVGGAKMPDAKTMGRWGVVLGPEVLKQVYERLVQIARDKGVTAGRRMRVDTTVVETDVHYPTDSTVLGDGVRVLTRIMRKITQIAGMAGTKLRDRSRSVKLRLLEIGRVARAKGPLNQEKLKQRYGRLLDSTSRVVGQATLCWNNQPWRRDSNQTASGNPGRFTPCGRREVVSHAIIHRNSHITKTELEVISSVRWRRRWSESEKTLRPLVNSYDSGQEHRPPDRGLVKSFRIHAFHVEKELESVVLSQVVLLPSGGYPCNRLSRGLLHPEVGKMALSALAREQVMKMDVEELEGGVTIVVLRGRLGSAGVEAIDARFKEVAGSKRAIVVDLSQVNFLTSIAIRMLVLGARAVANRGGKLVLASPSEWASFVLQAAEIEQLIPVVFNRSAAIAAVRPI
jgi:anti-anti-sigma factor